MTEERRKSTEQFKLEIEEVRIVDNQKEKT